MTPASASGPVTQPLLVLLLAMAAAEVVEVVEVVMMEHDRDNVTYVLSSSISEQHTT